jgi:hypothetical protein
VGHPLWQKDRSVVCSAITHWSKSHRTHNHILLSRLRLPQPGGWDPCIYIPQEHCPISNSVWFILRSTNSRPVHLDVGVHDQIFFPIFSWFWSGAPSLTRWQVCSLYCSLWSGSLRTHNHTLLSHPILAHLYPQALGSLSAASYDSELWWMYSNLPTHGNPAISCQAKDITYGQLANLSWCQVTIWGP